MLRSSPLLLRTLRSAKAITRPLSSTAAASSAEHKPVITIHGLQARYANATYVAASRAGALEQVEAELNGLAAAATKPGAWASLLQNPLIPRAQKVSAVQGLSDKLNPTTVNLLTTLAGNARLAELPKVASTYQQLLKAKRGQMDAQIISAQPLTKAQHSAVQTAMQSHVPKGKTVLIETVIDPSIVGGLQVQIGDQFLDLSVKSRIEDISTMSVE